MWKGLDGVWIEAIGAILVAFFSGMFAALRVRGKNKIDANKNVVDGLINLVNELQQERDNVRQLIRESERVSARCNRRVDHLQDRMSKLVIYVRKIEQYLRDHRMFDKAPKFDWKDFYRPQHETSKDMT